MVLTVGIGAALATAANWTPPTQEPPANNTPAPINVGPTALQTIDGALTVKGLIETTTALGGIKFPDGTIQKTAAVTTNVGGEGCYPMAGNNCLVGYYMSGIATCCPLDANKAFTPGVWFLNKLAVSYPREQTYNNVWSPKKTDSFVAQYAINKIRIKGSADDGGYCYAYWGTGHAQTSRNTGASGLFTVDGKWYGAPNAGQWFSNTVNGACPQSLNPYPGSPHFTKIPVCDNVDWEGYCTDPEQAYGCGFTRCPFGANTFDDTGNAKICATNYDSGNMTTIVEDVVIPAGATVTLQGRHANGWRHGYLSCALDFQYTP